VALFQGTHWPFIHTYWTFWNMGKYSNSQLAISKCQNAEISDLRSPRSRSYNRGLINDRCPQPALLLIKSCKSAGANGR
jgi:hypothetical protein